MRNLVCGVGQADSKKGGCALREPGTLTLLLAPPLFFLRLFCEGQRISEGRLSALIPGSEKFRGRGGNFVRNKRTKSKGGCAVCHA